MPGEVASAHGVRKSEQNEAPRSKFACAPSSKQISGTARGVRSTSIPSAKKFSLGSAEPVFSNLSLCKSKKEPYLRYSSFLIGGDGEIRTLELVSELHDFQSCALDLFSKSHCLSGFAVCVLID